MFPLLLLLGVGLYVATRKSDPEATPGAGAAPGAAPGAADENAGRETGLKVGPTGTTTSESSFGSSAPSSLTALSTLDKGVALGGASPVLGLGGVKPTLSTTADWPGSRVLPEAWRVPVMALLSFVDYGSVKAAVNAGGKLSIMKGGDDSWIAAIVCPSGKCPAASDARRAYEVLSADYITIESQVGREVAEHALFEMRTVASTLARREGLASYEPELPFVTAGGGL